MPKLKYNHSHVTALSLTELAAATRTERVKFWKTLAQSEEEVELVWISACTSNNVQKKELLKVNYRLPVEAISTITSTTRLTKVTTFGTVLEGRGLKQNNYVESKERLSGWLAQNLEISNLRHIRTHTLVSKSLPQSHMFLGQLLTALKNKQALVFKTNGRQVREYLDLETFVSFVSDAICTNSDGVGAVETVGGGSLLSLRQIVKLISDQYFTDLEVRFVTDEDTDGEVFPENPIKNSIILPFQDSKQLLLRRFGEWLGDV
ncbi:hypothetical protein OAQ27_04025 [Aquiluna sp.]|nr:hypothetical protein [Aquiluna sp.]